MNLITLIFSCSILGTVYSRVVQKRQAGGDPCDRCHRALSDCSHFPFKNERDQADIIVWSQCMEQAFQDWKYNTGTDFWPVADALIHGPVGPARIDRQLCFDQIVENRECISCGLQHPVAALELHDASAQCWDYVAQSQGQQAQPQPHPHGPHPHPQGLIQPGHPQQPHPGFIIPGHPHQHPHAGHPPQHPHHGHPQQHPHPHPGFIHPGQQQYPHPSQFHGHPQQGPRPIFHPLDPRARGQQHPGQIPQYPGGGDPRFGGQRPQVLLVPVPLNLPGQHGPGGHGHGHPHHPRPFFPQGGPQHGPRLPFGLPQQGHGPIPQQGGGGGAPPGIGGLLGPVPDLPVPPTRSNTGGPQPVPRAPAPSGGLLGHVPDLPVPPTRPNIPQKPSTSFRKVPSLPASVPQPGPPGGFGGLFGPVPDLPVPPPRPVNDLEKEAPELKISEASGEIKDEELPEVQTTPDPTLDGTTENFEDMVTTETIPVTETIEDESQADLESSTSDTIMTTAMAEATTEAAPTTMVATTVATTTTTKAPTTTTKKPKRGGRRRGGRRRNNRRRKTTTQKPTTTTPASATTGNEDSDGFWSADK